METLNNVYELNKSIEKLREQMLHLVYDDSQRSLDLDRATLVKMNSLKLEYHGLARQRNEKLKHVYSHTFSRPKTAYARLNRSEPSTSDRPLIVKEPLVIDIRPATIPRSVQSPKLRIIAMVIKPNSTTFHMTPKWFKPDDETKVLRTVKYPPNSTVAEKRQFNTVARFRAVEKKANYSGDFIADPIEVEEKSAETLVLALDAFVEKFGGKLSFTDDPLSFDDSTHRAACGVSHLGSAHLLATDFISSAKFVLVVNVDYDELAKSSETMENFISTFAHAVAQDLSCDNDYVRVTSVGKSKKGKGKAEVSLVLTTPNVTRTEELADTFKDHLRSGFSDKNILGCVERDDYQCQWMPALSYLQLRPSDFDPRYNNDYASETFPKELMRGGLPYHLPNYWFRHGLKVDDKYKDGTDWLGSGNDSKVWPVAYHGTHSKAVRGITDSSLLVTTVKTDLMREEAVALKGEAVDRPGLYVATHCNGGSHPAYTSKFDTKTASGNIETFEVVFQCRVRQDSYTSHKDPVQRGEAWRIVDPSAVRPYGILLKNIKTEVPSEYLTD